jgi:Rad3-related DNA helicase
MLGPKIPALPVSTTVAKRASSLFEAATLSPNCLFRRLQQVLTQMLKLTKKYLLNRPTTCWGT